MAKTTGIIVADFTTQLATKLLVGGTTATLQSATDDDSVALPAGRYFFTIDGDNSQKEHISCDLSGTSLTNIKTVSRQGVETSGAAREHRVGASVKITDFAHIKKLNDLLDGTTNLNASEPLEYDGTAAILGNNYLATKAYVDSVATGGVVTNQSIIVTGNAGETVAAGQLVYLDATDNEWKLTDADTAATVNNTMLGIAQGAGTNGNAITGGVLLQGLDTNQTGLTAGDTVYAGNTAGSISSTPGTTEVALGIVRPGSTTDIYFMPRFDSLLTKNQRDALAGDAGTPNSSNPYLTKESQLSDIQTFTTSGTWTKPSRARLVHVLLWGGGGSGGSVANSALNGAGGGGGGSFAELIIQASSLASTVSVTVGAGGAAVANGNNGNAGTSSSFGSHVTAYGGGAGSQGTSSANDGSGGGGGGPLGAGGNAGTNVAGTAGAPGSPVSGVGGSHATSNGAGKGLYSGGGAGNVGSVQQAGGDSFFGGAGGGAARSVAAAAGGTSTWGGAGGAAAIAGSATAGSARGGGGGAACSTGGSSGAGGRGEVTVISYY